MNIKSIPYIFFLGGFAYYGLLPIVFLYFFQNYPIAQIAISNSGSKLFLELYSALAFVFLICFSVGYYFSLRTKKFRVKTHNIDKVKELRVIISFLYIVFTIFSINVTEIISLVGYLGEYDVAHRGQLTTLYLTSIWWFIYFKTDIHAKLMLFIALLAGLNLLALGSRLGVLTGIISMIIYYGYFAKENMKFIRGSGLGSVKGILTLTVVLVLMTSVGLIREGSSITVEGALSIFSAEPLFIYASVPAYFSNTSLPLFAIPVDIFASVIAAIPSFMFSAKVDFFAEYTSVDRNSLSGFGGMNHLVSLVANFGLIGFPFAAFLEGAWFGMLIKNAYKSPFFRAVAITSISVIPFIMFRDGFQTTIKILFFNFLLFPYIATRVLLFLKRSVRPSVARPF